MPGRGRRAAGLPVWRGGEQRCSKLLSSHGTLNRGPTPLATRCPRPAPRRCGGDPDGADNPDFDCKPASKMSLTTCKSLLRHLRRRLRGNLGTPVSLNLTPLHAPRLGLRDLDKSMSKSTSRGDTCGKLLRNMVFADLANLLSWGRKSIGGSESKSSYKRLARLMRRIPSGSIDSTKLFGRLSLQCVRHVAYKAAQERPAPSDLLE